MNAEERFFVVYFFFKFEGVVIEVFLKFKESEELTIPGLFFSIGLSDNLNQGNNYAGDVSSECLVVNVEHDSG